MNEARHISGAKTKTQAIEIALRDYIKREKGKILRDLEGNIELAFTLDEFLTILLHFFINWLFMRFLKMDSRFHGNDKKWYFAPICVIPA
ncbi:MAG: type II toxin-antitoxin system VapB family antitoxin [Magnetococcales bacterium]|nr:type II toxin-antitoxin system VapB family antitoxin [Nitrospirota bacterium]